LSNFINFSAEKKVTNIGAKPVIKKTPEKNNRPVGENLPNLGSML
jgi:hypothetical protein